MIATLAKIIKTKKSELEKGKSQCGIVEMRSRANAADAPRPFFAPLTQPEGELRVISEVKRASPSAGLIRADFDPVAIAQAYAQHGAAAISCLTDVEYFQGDLAYIAQIRRAVPIPVLRKDFMIDPWHIYQARAAQADAVLLIAECLEDGQIDDLMGLALEIGMGVLLEVHDGENLLRVRDRICGKPVLLGINNRDLRVMKTDLAHTLELLPEVPDVKHLVSESGIRTRDDVQRLQKAGVHRVLVGEHLMRQPDPGIALADLMT